MNDLIFIFLVLTLPLYYTLIGFIFIMGEFEVRKTFLKCLIPYYGIFHLINKAWKDMN